jgi:uncharacterized membrane protein
LDILEFIDEYYIQPIIMDSGYNIYNTLTWAVLLGLSLFGIIKLLQRLNLKVNAAFVMALAPHIVFWASMRVVEDMNLVQPPQSYILITPIIYFLAFVVTVPLLVICVWFGKRGTSWIPDYQRPMFWTGIVMVIALYVWMLLSGPVERAWVPLMVVTLGAVFTGAIYTIACIVRSRAEKKLAAVASGKGKKKGVMPEWVALGFLKDRLNLTLLFAHMFDASSTFTGVDIIALYEEKHVFPGFFIEVTGTSAVMYPLKLVIFIPVLYILSRWYEEDEQLSNLIKFVILVLGFGPGIRNTLAMFFGV